MGKNIVLQALRPMDPGMCVSENYGPLFTKRPLAFRQKTLASRYWFKCNCQACTEDWPTYDTLSNDNLRLRYATELWKLMPSSSAIQAHTEHWPILSPSLFHFSPLTHFTPMSNHTHRPPSHTRLHLRKSDFMYSVLNNFYNPWSITNIQVYGNFQYA